MTTPLSPTARSTVRRGARRARTDRAELYAVLDAGLVGHLGVMLDGAPVVLPTGYGRVEDTLYLHGSTGAATLRAAAAGAPVCLTVTHVDGVVYARSSFHHSMNYRCAVVHGVPRPVHDPDERERGLAALTEQLAPGSWDATRRPDRRELAATAVLALDLAEASLKVRTGPPGDDDRDLSAPVWGGVLPVRTVFGEPVDDPLLPPGVGVPARVRDRLSPAG
ncbi:pyridoxamine 5'-phosphate oxidase family protein [Modestobacter sp. VKM Ac-2986]|uniref:pyridoxamine 5'-phosphate oxidase family protein n=1 Tax=Modestobacter sp. VKM Ac-2986 TaxID=3004140 RepID=UPI0022AAB4CE|nr:pyridoxamine 5'-phosphate oxidase family protein [Modestobacter sp. VKM Ac-2986]MCZ2827953.1 pyridoxamine 5'-phosphate oxidase family protein [Modestobacter sp. VKM Ac-2986]